jgi:hypothetical protein
LIRGFSTSDTKLSFVGVVIRRSVEERKLNSQRALVLITPEYNSEPFIRRLD